MSSSRHSDITQLLKNWQESGNELAEFVLPELKRIASARMSHERLNHTLQPTALISELYIYLGSRREVKWQNRAHFYAVCSEAMHRILVDHARAKRAQKRGGSVHITDLEGVDAVAPDHAIDVLVFDELLEQLSKQDERMTRGVQLRFFGGLTTQEIAEVLGIHERTVKRDWQVARAWLYGQIRKNQAGIDSADDDSGMGAG